MNDSDRDPDPETIYDTIYVPVDTRELQQMAAAELEKRRMPGGFDPTSILPDENEVQKAREKEQLKMELYKRLIDHNDCLTREFEQRCRELIKAGDSMEVSIRLKNKGLDAAAILELKKSWREGF